MMDEKKKGLYSEQGSNSNLRVMPAIAPGTSSPKMVNAKTSTTEKLPQKTPGEDEEDMYTISIRPQEIGLSNSKEGLQKNTPLLDFILNKVKEELRRPESHMYTNSKGKFKQVYELINDNRDLRELAKKLNLHIDHHYEKVKLKELHEENVRSQTKQIPHKQITEEKKLEARMKMNQK